LDNSALEKEFSEWNADKIEAKIGIRERHISAVGETSLDLAYQAGMLLLKDIDKSKIDFLILCTQSPDYFLPTSACVLQAKLGLNTACGAFDINLGCSGFIYGLAVAKGLISVGIANNVLLITAETYSKFIHPLDKGNRSIFGDGAAATLIESSTESGLGNFSLGTDGTGFDKLIVKTGGMRYPDKVNPVSLTDDDGNFMSADNLFMNGSDIFNFTIDVVPDLVQEVLKANNLQMEDVNYFIFHQANKFILDYLRDYIEIPQEKFYLNLTNTGNTVSATIPIALADCIQNKIVKPGDKVMLIGFGVGLSWGGCLINI
jgi:3-oxoacyl-[acyl-carrier-protein] synthase-3